jgi:hypothetical protein
MLTRKEHNIYRGVKSIRKCGAVLPPEERYAERCSANGRQIALAAPSACIPAVGDVSQCGPLPACGARGWGGEG